MGARCWGVLVPTEIYPGQTSARMHFLEQFGRVPDKLHGPRELHGPFWWMGWVTFQEAQRASNLWYVRETWVPLRLQSLAGVSCG